LIAFLCFVCSLGLSMPAPKSSEYTLLQVRLSRAYDAAVRQAAADDEVTLTDFARAAIKEALRRRGIDPSKFKAEARA
jgi:hypothetical protein